MKIILSKSIAKALQKVIRWTVLAIHDTELNEEAIGLTMEQIHELINLESQIDKELKLKK